MCTGLGRGGGKGRDGAAAAAVAAAVGVTSGEPAPMLGERPVPWLSPMLGDPRPPPRRSRSLVTTPPTRASVPQGGVKVSEELRSKPAAAGALSARLGGWLSPLPRARSGGRASAGGHGHSSAALSPLSRAGEAAGSKSTARWLSPHVAAAAVSCAGGAAAAAPAAPAAPAAAAAAAVAPSACCSLVTPPLRCCARRLLSSMRRRCSAVSGCGAATAATAPAGAPTGAAAGAAWGGWEAGGH